MDRTKMTHLLNTMPNKVAALALHVERVQRGILTGLKVDATILRDDARTVRAIANILDSCAAASDALPER